MQLLNDTAKKYTYYLYCLVYGGVLVTALYFFFQFGGLDHISWNIPFSIGAGNFFAVGYKLLGGMFGAAVSTLLYLTIQLRLAYLSIYKKRLNIIYPIIFLSLYLYGLHSALQFLRAL